VLEPAPERHCGSKAEPQREKDAGKAINKAVAASRKRDITLKARLVDLDIARRCGDHLVAVDEEGFGGVGSNGDLARNGDYGPVEDSAGDFDTARALGIQSAAGAKVEKARLEASLLLRQCAAAGRQLEIVDTKLIDGGGTLIEKIADGT